jgi:hypothetical protein
LNRRASCRRFSVDANAMSNKMVFPSIAPRMKQRYNLLRRRVDSAQIRSLAQITPLTREREIRRVIRSAVLARDDGFDVVPDLAMRLG